MMKVAEYTSGLILIAVIAAFFVFAGYTVGKRNGSSPTSDQAAINNAVSLYRQRLDEAEKGLSFWKSLAEKKVEPETIAGKPDTIFRDNFFALPTTGKSVPESVLVPVYFNFEYPFLVRGRGDSLYVDTYNRAKDRVTQYGFGGIGQTWDMTFNPRDTATTQVALFTSRDWFVFRGFGLGTGYSIFKPGFYGSGKVASTLFKTFDLDLTATTDKEVKINLHYTF